MPFFPIIACLASPGCDMLELTPLSRPTGWGGQNLLMRGEGGGQSRRGEERCWGEVQEGREIGKVFAEEIRVREYGSWSA